MVLEAAAAAGVEIPTLCYLKDLNCIGSCRVCLVDVEGEGLLASCNTAVREGMRVRTDTHGGGGPTGEPAGHHGRPSGALRHLRAPGHLRPALPFQHLQPAGCRRGPCRCRSRGMPPSRCSATAASASSACAAWPSATRCSTAACGTSPAQAPR
ncbi:MAG: 2Fe-2S iron-sulfur cluster-binding protein [Collinsella sp.]